MRWIARARRLDRRWIDRVLAGGLLVIGEVELLARAGSPEPRERRDRRRRLPRPCSGAAAGR